MRWYTTLDDPGTTVTDSTGSHHGTKTGALPPVSIGGREGLDFRSRNFWVNSNKTGTQLGIGGNVAKTIEAWAYTTAFNNGSIFDIGTNADPQTIGLRTTNNNNQWLADFWSSGQNGNFPTPPVMSGFILRSSIPAAAAGRCAFTPTASWLPRPATPIFR